MNQIQRNKRTGGYKGSVLEFVYEKVLTLLLLNSLQFNFFFFAYNNSNLPQQGGNPDRCGMGCVVLDWCGRSWAELTVVLPLLPGWGPAPLPCSPPPCLPFSPQPHHLHLPFQTAAVLALQLRLAIKWQRCFMKNATGL